MKHTTLLLTIALSALLLASSAFADDFCTVQNHKDKFCGSLFEYQTVSVADEKYKAFENAVNGYVEEQIQSDKDWLRENAADYPYLKDCKAAEIWITVNVSGNYLNATIIYWYYTAASPWYLCKSFTLDTEKNALVTLAEITGLSGNQILDEVLRQLYECNEMSECDCERLSDVLDNREFYAEELENQAFVFTNDDRIYLRFDKEDFFGKPDFDFYLDVKK